VTFDDEVLFDAHRLTETCMPPERLDLVAVGHVWCRLLTGPQPAAACRDEIRAKATKSAITTLIGFFVSGFANFTEMTNHDLFGLF
jgi:hypothetical protein